MFFLLLVSFFFHFVVFVLVDVCRMEEMCVLSDFVSGVALIFSRMVPWLGFLV